MLIPAIVSTIMLCLFIGLSRASIVIFSFCLAALSPYNLKLLIPLILIASYFALKHHIKKKF